MTFFNEAEEASRVAAVHRLALTGGLMEPEFDDLVQLAAAICEVPISLLTIIDEDRQWMLSSVGIAVKEIARDQTFCQYTILQDELLMVEDTMQHNLFVTHPAVVGDPNVRFYAGISIKSPDGEPVGTLCVVDVVPRKMSETQVNALRMLARQANARLELREQRRELQQALAESEQAKAKLAISEARFVTFMDSAPFLSYLKDSEGRFVFYNRVISERYGISREEWLGKTIQDVFPDEDTGPFHAHDLEVIAEDRLIVREELWTSEGADAYLRMYRFPCRNGDSVLMGAIVLDVTEEVEHHAILQRYQKELEAANAKLSELAETDALTGLANRRKFDERLIVEFSQARRKKRALSVVMIDVDNFKQLNDQYGHDKGDACLKQIAGMLAEMLRESDLIARYGGEEFVLLLPETDASQAAQLGARLLAAMRSASWDCMPMTISGGIAEMDPSTMNGEQMVSQADEAMYAAKRAGKDQIVRGG